MLAYLDLYVPPNALELLTAETYTIPSVFQDHEKQTHRSSALGDYCAKYNFISSTYAAKLKYPIAQRNAKDVKIGSGEKVRTLGTVDTRFSFEGESRVYDLVFHVLPGCLKDVILGKPFLRESHTLSNLKNFASRIRKSIGNMIDRHHLLFLGDSAPTFTGLINGIPARALADSGSSVLVMDEAFATNLGLPIDRGSRTRLLFADGSTTYTTGTTRGVQWQFGPALDAEGYYRDFHILENAPAPIILNDSFLFGTEAFSKYDCYLLDELEEDDDGYCCHITTDHNCKPQGKFHAPQF
jgi:hypothetical protein